MSLTETIIFSFLRLCRWQKHLFSLFRAYVVDRNTYFLFFMLMSLTETSIFSFSCLCRWQKHLFSLFHAYVVDRNIYFLFFALMSLTETPIFSFLRLCRWQKRLFSIFGLSETFRSMKNLLLLFLKCSEARKTSIWPFWNVQKHENKKIICKITIQSLFLYANEDLLNLEIPHGTQEWYEMSHELTHASSTHYAYELLYKGAWEI